MFKKILLILMIMSMISVTCYGKPYVEYTLNTSPAMTDTALGVTDPDLIPTGWTFRNYLWSDIFALYLTQDWIPTGAVDLSTATGAVLMGRQSNQIFYDGTFTMTTVVFSWTGNHTHEYGDYDSQAVASTEIDASGIVSGVKSVTAGTGMTNSGTATNPILDVTASGASITEVATEPAAVDMDPGTLYVNQDNGGLSYLLNDSSFVNRYAATSSTALHNIFLTVAETDGSTVDINGTSYSNGGPYTISALTGSIPMDISYVTADQTVWTGADSGAVTGTTPNFFVDTTAADKTLIATISSSISFLFSEDFEGIGTPTDWTTFFEEAQGTVNYDNTTDPLAGTKSMQITSITYREAQAITPPFTASSSVSASIIFRADTVNTSSVTNWIAFKDAGDSIVCKVRLLSAGTISMIHGTIASSTSSALIVQGTVYYLWVDLTNGAGTGVMSFYQNSVNTKPGTPFLTMTNGDNVADITNVVFSAQHSGIFSFDNTDGE